MQWFRMYAEAVDDEKLRLLAFEDRWHFVALLCLKAQGTLDEKNPELRIRKICIKLGLDSVELETVMKRLETVGLVSHDYEPVSWRKRQFLSDSSTSRVQAFRQRQRNVSETPSESDTEQKQKKKGADAPVVLHTSLPEESWNEWLAHRREKRLSMSPRALNKQLKLLAEYPPAIQREIIDTSINAGWEGLFRPKGKAAKPEAKSEWM